MNIPFMDRSCNKIVWDFYASKWKAKLSRVCVCVSVCIDRDKSYFIFIQQIIINKQIGKYLHWFTLLVLFLFLTGILPNTSIMMTFIFTYIILLLSTHKHTHIHTEILKIWWTMTHPLFSCENPIMHVLCNTISLHHVHRVPTRSKSGHYITKYPKDQ